MPDIAIPQEWQDILRKVQVVSPSAVIAGGALRDLDNGKEIKDVDIFVPLTTNPDVEKILLDLFGEYDVTVDESNVYGESGNEDQRDLYSILRFESPNWKYDLILCSPSACELENFDINICQITYDGSRIKVSNHYTAGVTNLFIKVVKPNRTDRNAKRVERLHAKYPEFTIEPHEEELPF